MAVFRFELLGLKPKFFLCLTELVLVWTHVKFCFKDWVSSLLSSLQLLTRKDRVHYRYLTKTKIEFGFFIDSWLKVSKIRKQIVKPWILPKNERMNSTLLCTMIPQVDFFSFVFWKNLKTFRNCLTFRTTPCW